MIEGILTVVRAMEPEDEIAIAPWFTTHDSNLAYGICHSPSNIQKIRDLFISNVSGPPDRRNFLIEDKHTKKRIGMFQFNKMDWFSRSLGIGNILFSEEDRHRGYGTDARLHVLDFVFNSWNMRYVYGEYASYHKEIEPMNKRIGAEIVGTLPNSVFVDGHFFDTIYYALDKDTFNNHFLNQKDQWTDYIVTKFNSAKGSIL